MSVTMVKVANGSVVPCNQQLLKGLWSCAGHEFTSTFKVFPLGSYDGILGLDWLAAHSPMQVDWAAHWISFHLEDKLITLLGQDAAPQMFALVELSSLLVTETPSLTDVPPEFKKYCKNLLLCLRPPLVCLQGGNMTTLFHWSLVHNQYTAGLTELPML